MASRLRLGIIGLGRRWQRYRQALMALTEELRVVAVHDALLRRGEEEARHLDAHAVGGVIELLERRDIDAVLLTGGGWRGLWPIEQAFRANKPVLCAVPPCVDEENINSIRDLLKGNNSIHLALWPSLTLVRETLSERLGESLGRPVFLQATWTRPHEGQHHEVLSSPAALALLRECADLFGAAPMRVTTQGMRNLVSVVVTFSDEQSAQLTLWAGPAARHSCRLQVEAENGAGLAELPRWVEWLDGEGRHRHELPAGLAEVITLDRFAQAVRNQEPPRCGFEEACQALDWLRAARQSGLASKNE
jgi:predicted dehydrogenase